MDKNKMSFIRVLSNPEKLYIFSDGEFAEIMRPDDETIFIPIEDFYNFIKGYVDEFYPDEYEYKNLSYKEEIRKNNELKSYFRFGNIEIEMWYVTWSYRVNNVNSRNQ